MAGPGLGLGICIQPLQLAVELSGLSSNLHVTAPGAATHCFVLFAEDWHGHRGEEHRALCLWGEELLGRRG